MNPISHLINTKIYYGIFDTLWIKLDGIVIPVVWWMVDEQIWEPSVGESVRNNIHAS